jgi:cyclic pyranopterin phosphate synthase
MSRCGDLAQVWAGLKSAQNAGLEIKLNTVVVRGWNDGQDIARIASLTREHAWHVRFIELMPLGRIAQVQQARVVSSEETMNTVTEALGALLPMKTVGGDAEAARYRLEGAPGTIGFISSVTRPFCRRCHRVRLTSDGRLRLCLLRENEVDLLTPLRSGATDAELLGLVREGIYRKPLEHGLHGNILARNRIMSEIGG